MERTLTAVNTLQSKIKDLKGRLQSETAEYGPLWETLCLQKEKLSNLFRSNDVITITNCKDGRIVYVNDAFLDITGYSREEVIGHTSLELGIWVDPDQRSELIGLLRENGSAYDCQAKFRTKSGDIYSAPKFIELLEFNDEQYIISAAYDIPDFKRTIEVLELERSKLKGILESMDDGVCIINQQYNIEYANPSLVGEFGLVNGQTCYEYFHDAKSVCPSCRNRDVFDGKSVRWEWYSSKVDKTYDLLDIPMKDAAGGIAKLEIFHDITGRKQAEEALQESEKRYRILVETMYDGLVLRENGVITYVNDRLCEMLGYSREELIRRPFIDFFDKENQSILEEQEDRLKRGEFGSFEILWTRKDGQKVSTIASPKPIVDGNGQLTGCFAVIHDITVRKQAEEQLKLSYEQLRSLSAHLQLVSEKERTNIAREIHDELGQALTALKMDISWIGSKLSRDQNVLFDKTHSMLKLVDKTIKIVKKIITELRPGVLDDLGLTAALEWQAKEFQKRTGIPCDVTFNPETINLERDHSTAIFRIFQEALTNVARHAEATRVKIRFEVKDDEIVLTVSDNGKGITGRQIANTKSFGIIGMRERVNFLGGEVKIIGTRKKGTYLTVTIPRAIKEKVIS